MSEVEPALRPTWATLSEMKAFVWVDGLWHRVSQWRGLRPGEGIPDDQRVARTFCAKFVPYGSATLEDLPKSVIDADEECPDCEREHQRIDQLR